jgi:hypothetical protein
MTRNIYDKQEFFEGYRRLPRSVEGLEGAPEWTSGVKLVGRGRIELPTQGFSVLCSTD